MNETVTCSCVPVHCVNKIHFAPDRKSKRIFFCLNFRFFLLRSRQRTLSKLLFIIWTNIGHAGKEWKFSSRWKWKMNVTTRTCHSAPRSAKQKYMLTTMCRWIANDRMQNGTRFHGIGLLNGVKSSAFVKSRDHEIENTLNTKYYMLWTPSIRSTWYRCSHRVLNEEGKCMRKKREEWNWFDGSLTCKFSIQFIRWWACGEPQLRRQQQFSRVAVYALSHEEDTNWLSDSYLNLIIFPSADDGGGLVFFVHVKQ